MKNKSEKIKEVAEYLDNCEKVIEDVIATHDSEYLDKLVDYTERVFLLLVEIAFDKKFKNKEDKSLYEFLKSKDILFHKFREDACKFSMHFEEFSIYEISWNIEKYNDFLEFIEAISTKYGMNLPKKKRFDYKKIDMEIHSWFENIDKNFESIIPSCWDEETKRLFKDYLKSKLEAIKYLKQFEKHLAESGISKKISKADKSKILDILNYKIPEEFLLECKNLEKYKDKLSGLEF